MAAVAPMVLFPDVLGAPMGVSLIANAIAVAFVLFALIEIFGPVSGAYFNPVVTMVMLFQKTISAGKAAAYVLCQLVGGFAGIFFTHLMFFETVGEIFAVSQNVRSGGVFFGEIFGTFILVFAVLMCAKRTPITEVTSSGVPILPKPDTSTAPTSLIVGLLVGGQILATSSTMFANPMVTAVRIFTPTAAGIRPTDAAVFIAVQIIGAMIAWAVYKLIFQKSAPGAQRKPRTHM